MALPVMQTGAGNETSASTAAGTSVAVPKPPNIADNDLLLVYGLNRNQTAASTPPTGWTLVSPSGGNVVNSGYASFFYRYVNTASGEPTSYTFSSAANASGRMAFSLTRITGAHPTAPIDVVGVDTNGPSTTVPMVLAGITTTGPDRLIVSGVVAHISSGAASAWGFTSTDVTQGAKVASGPTTASTSTVTIGRVGQATSGSSGTKTFTPEGSVSADFGYLIAVTPAATSNAAPTANAGTAQTGIEPGATVTLSGSGSDSDGTISSYAWSQTGGVTVLLSGASTATATFTAPGSISGTTLTFQLTVTDNLGATDTSTVTVGTIASTELVRSTGAWLPRFTKKRSVSTWV